MGSLGKGNSMQSGDDCVCQVFYFIAGITGFYRVPMLSVGLVRGVGGFHHSALLADFSHFKLHNASVKFTGRILSLSLSKDLLHVQ